MSILDSFIAVEQKIDGIAKAMTDTTIPESQRKNAFIEYKSYLDKAKSKMGEAKASGDAVIIQKADEVIKKIDACLTQFGQSMDITPAAGDDFVDNVIVHNNDNAKVLNATVSPIVTPTESKIYFVQAFNGSFVKYEGDKPGLNDL
jgi:hypothetical protein